MAADGIFSNASQGSTALSVDVQLARIQEIEFRIKEIEL
jgi:hypothetical protein